MYPVHHYETVQDATGATRIDAYGMDGTDDHPLIAQARRDLKSGEWIATYFTRAREARGHDKYAAIHAAIHGEETP